ncbi:MAG: ROK family protein [Oscillospiraceae bacterium]|nr:ROK family protein [Oscillospiraceae bacterium]
MYRVGIDIGGTSIKIGVVDDALQIVRRSAIPFRCVGGEAVAAMIAEEIHKLLAQEPKIEKIESVGVVLPGSIDKTQSIVLDAHNLDFHNVPFRAQLQAQFPELQVYLANDADGAALAELGRGAFEGCKTAVLLTLGTGVGGGVILGGKLFSGGTGLGAELGHMTLVNGGEYCTCGNHGCVEAYCSATALKRDGIRAMKAHPESLLAKKSGGDEALIDAKFVIDCAKEGDETAMAVFDAYVDHLAAACISVVHILDPEVIAIGGGVCHAGEFLFEPLRRGIDEKCFFSEHGKIVPAVMGNDAGIVGAAMLALNA